MPANVPVLSSWQGNHAADFVPAHDHMAAVLPHSLEAKSLECSQGLVP
jgi:hypothetical protein